MRGGFSFCGVDIADLGLEYAPEMEETYVYRPADKTIHEQTFDSHNGGYFYGITSRPKDFRLRCIFEESHINKKITSRAYQLFQVGRSGKLVFQQRPWVYYNVAIVESTLDPTNYLNGYFHVVARAYYPYGRSDQFTIPQFDVMRDFMKESTAMVTDENMLAPFNYDSTANTFKYTNITANRTILLPNPGTERAAVGIKIAGNVGNGVTVGNNTTGQACTFMAITKANTTNLNRYVYLDSLNGKTLLLGNGYKQTAFVYHHDGVIELAPNYPAKRDVIVTLSNSNTVRITNYEKENFVGQYIYLAGQWRKINSQPENTKLVLDSTPSGTGIQKAPIMPLNELYVSSVSGMDLSLLEFVYRPTFA